MASGTAKTLRDISNAQKITYCPHDVFKMPSLVKDLTLRPKIRSSLCYMAHRRQRVNSCQTLYRILLYAPLFTKRYQSTLRSAVTFYFQHVIHEKPRQKEGKLPFRCCVENQRVKQSISWSSPTKPQPRRCNDSFWLV